MALFSLGSHATCLAFNTIQGKGPSVPGYRFEANVDLGFKSI